MLEHMYWFLTYKRKDENHVEDHCAQLSKALLTSASRDTDATHNGQSNGEAFCNDSEISGEEFQYSGISRSLKAISHQPDSVFGVISEDFVTRGSDKVKLASLMESSLEQSVECDVNFRESVSVDDFTLPISERKDVENGATVGPCSLYDVFDTVTTNQRSHKANSCLNAVERARLKEAKKIKEMTTISEPRRIQSHHLQASLDPRLAFRSPNRQRDFKSYTLKDYKRQQPGGYVMLGKLGPETTHELELKRKMLLKMKEFGRGARAMAIPQEATLKKFKQKTLSNREKALKFASTIPKPKLKEVAKELQEPQHPTGHTLTELEILEAKHQADKQQFEMIRRDLESFLR